MQEGTEAEPFIETITSVEVGGGAWGKELDRAVIDVGGIAKSRLAKMSAEKCVYLVRGRPG